MPCRWGVYIGKAGTVAVPVNRTGSWCCLLKPAPAQRGMEANLGEGEKLGASTGLHWYAWF